VTRLPAAAANIRTNPRLGPIGKISEFKLRAVRVKKKLDGKPPNNQLQGITGAGADGNGGTWRGSGCRNGIFMR